jgi:ABC-type Fe3+ transport system substrate-binding protein
MRRLWLALAGMALLSACGGGQAAPAATAPSSPGPSRAAAQASGSAPAAGNLQSMVAAARQEGQLTLSWTAETLGPQEDFHKYADAFNAMYGLQLKVSFTPGPSMPQMAAKTVEEAQTNRPATSDVALGEALHVITMDNAGALAAPNWNAWAPAIRNPALLSPDGKAVAFELVFPGITYNTSKLNGDAVPKTLQDLLKPEYKGRIASTIYASSFDRLSTPTMWGKQATLDYVHKFSQQLGGLIRCPDAQGKLLDGEFDLFALDCNQGNALRAQAKGEPLGFVIPSDAAILSDVYVTVPKNASHPNAAKLYVDFLLSRQAQDMFFPVDYVDSYLLPGSKTAELVNTYKAQGVKFTVSDVRFFQENDLAQMRQNLNQIVEIFQKPNG